MATSVLIPWAGQDPHRQAALEWVKARYANEPWQLVTGTCEGAWCKARAVADATSRADGDLFVIADADVWSDGTTAAVTAVEAGEPWAVPHDLVHRLTHESTVQVYEGQEPCGLPTEQAPYRGRRGGGIVVVTRDNYQQAPLDPRFAGWGHEDESWALALKTMLGDGWRGTDDLFHLWHPPQQRLNRHVGSEPSLRLYHQHVRAQWDRQAMRRLIEEGRHVDRLRDQQVPVQAS